MRSTVPALLAATLLPAALLLPASSALAQADPPQPTAEFGCSVSPDNPCKGRVDFEKGRSFEFKISGPGEVTFLNEGNRRCSLEYSITESTLAATGKSMELSPGQSQVMTVRDRQGMIIRFFYRGYGSGVCDLTVSLKS